MFTPFPEITGLPTDQVEDFASYKVKKHIINTMADTLENSQNIDIEITGWNISNVTEMSKMFQGAGNFNQSLHSFHNNSPLGNELDVLQLTQQATQTIMQIKKQMRLILKAKHHRCKKLILIC